MNSAQPIASIILPVYHEEDNIAACLSGIGDEFHDTEIEILVCYDHEDDPTLAAIHAMPQPGHVRIIHNRLAPGPSAAMRVGMEEARGKLLILSMADLSDPPSVMRQMIQLNEAGKGSIVCASRYMSGGIQEGGPWLKSTLSCLAGLAGYHIARLHTHDCTNSFIALTPSVRDQLSLTSTEGFTLALEIVTKGNLAGIPITETPTHWRDRSAGESRFRLWKWLPMYLKHYGRAFQWWKKKPLSTGDQ
jgi:dolichol-phosphate mannosyltransferase